MNETMKVVGSIALAVIGVAIVAVIFSPKAQTVGVIQAATLGFGQILGVAVSPVTGGGGTAGLSASAAQYGQQTGFLNTMSNYL